MAILLVAILCGVPLLENVARADAPPSPHYFSGFVLNDSSEPVPGVEVTAWINGVQANNPAIPFVTDVDGQFGSLSEAEWMVVNGMNGENIVFKVDGIAAYITAVGTVVETPSPQWVWNPPARPEATTFAGGTTTGLKLVAAPGDTTPPAAITDLFATEATYDTVKLRWTAPGDNITDGRAIYYEVRYNTGTITADNWSSSTLVVRVVDPPQERPVPKTAGENETLSVSGLSANTTYYFAIRTYDEIGFPNGSNLSNCETIQTAANIGLQTHRFWGTVETTNGYPSANARVSAWVDGQLTHTLATDGLGHLGDYPFPSLEAHGHNGDAVTFKVEGIAAQVTQAWKYVPANDEWVPYNGPIVIVNNEIYQVALVYDSPDDTPPTVTVNTPNGGEKLKVNTPYDITWDATDDVGVTSVDISYSIDGGPDIPIISLAASNGPGTYTWTVPNTKSTACLVKVVAFDAGGNSGQDESNAVFRIYLPGDANDNGVVDNEDITATEHIILEEVSVPAPSLNRDADANEDGGIDVLDITKIEQIISP